MATLTHPHPHLHLPKVNWKGIGETIALPILAFVWKYGVYLLVLFLLSVAGLAVWVHLINAHFLGKTIENGMQDVPETTRQVFVIVGGHKYALKITRKLKRIHSKINGGNVR